MESSSIEKLIGLFEKLSDGSLSYKQKAESLACAKMIVLNEMSREQLVEFFVEHDSNFENLFLLPIWTPSVESGAQFLEPYDIIERIFSCFDSLLTLLEKFKNQLTFLVNQEQDEKVKHISLRHLIRLVQTLELSGLKERGEMLTELESNLKGVLPCLVSQMARAACSYSQLLADFLCILSRKLSELRLDKESEEAKLAGSIFNSDLVDEFEKVAMINSTLSFRVFEVVVKISCISEANLVEFGAAKFHLKEKIDAWLNDQLDVLSQLNCIELLGDLVITEHGFKFLLRSQHLTLLFTILTNFEQNPFGDFLLPAIVKFFAGLARKYPLEVNQNLPDFYRFLFDKSKEEKHVKLLVETFSFLLDSNLVNQFFLDHYESDFVALMHFLVSLVQFNIKHEIKAEALRAISEIIAPDPTLLDCFDSDIKLMASPFVEAYSDLCRSLYEKLTASITHEKLFSVCLNLAKQPFVETRLAAQTYFKALAQSKWGLALLFTPNKFNSVDEFVNGYLVNRGVELEKKGLESKYELIKLIEASYKSNVDLFRVVGNSNLVKFEEYLRQGAFFVGAEHAVSFESA